MKTVSASPIAFCPPPRTRSPTQLRPETYPATSCRRKADRRCEDRYKTMPITFEEIREVDEEPATTSIEPTRKYSDQGRSPYALHNSDAWLLPANHPLISPKFQRRPQFPTFNTTNQHRLSRGFSDPIVRRKKSTERLNSFELAVDLLNLPPIPEAPGPISPVYNNSRVHPLRRQMVEEETDDFCDDSSECSDFTTGSSS